MCVWVEESVADACCVTLCMYMSSCIELAAYKEKCRKTLQIIAKWFVYQMQKMNLDVQAPSGGFTLFPSFNRHRRALQQRGISTDVQLCAQLLHDTGVAILPGSCFGRAPDELYVRIAFVDFKGEIALYLIETMVRQRLCVSMRCC